MWNGIAARCGFAAQKRWCSGCGTMTLGDSGSDIGLRISFDDRCNLPQAMCEGFGIARGPQVTLKISLRWAHDGEGLLRSQLVFVVMAVVLPINHRASLRSCELLRVGV